MAIRGENVGTAYVRILADGSGLNKSIRDQFEDVDWDEMGRKGSKQWQDAFAEEQKKAPNRRQLMDAIAGPLVRGKWLTEEFFRGKNWTSFRSAMDKEFGEAGARAADNLERELYEGLNFDGLTKRLDNITPDVIRAEKQLAAERAAVQREAEREERERLKRHLEAMVKLNQDRDRDLERHWADLATKARESQEALQKLTQDRDREMDAHWADLAAKARASQEALQKLNLDRDREMEAHWARLAAAARESQEEMTRIQNLGRMQERAHNEDRARELDMLRQKFALLGRESQQLLAGDRRAMGKRSLQNMLGEIREGMERLNYQNVVWDETLRDTDNSLRVLHPRLRRVNVGVDRFSDSVGKTFGRGARNNFIHAIGTMTRGMVRLATLPLKVGSAMFSFGSSLMDVYKVARQTGGVLQGLGAVGGSLLKSFAKTGPVAAAGIIALAASLGIVTATVSGLVGILTALSGTVVFAAAGAIGSLAAILLPLGAAAAVAAGGFMTLSDEAKKALKLDVKPLVRQFRELGKAGGQTMFANVKEQVRDLTPIIGGLVPMFRRVGAAISDVGSAWIKSMDSPAFRQWRDAMTDFLPDAVRSMGRVIGQFTGGMGGLFRGMIPFMEQTLGWLDRITSRFSEWASSAEGQQSIKRFFSDAADSAKSLGGFLGSVWDFLWKILGAGRQTGDSIFDNMAASIERASKWIDKNPNAVADWFGNAKDLAGDIGDIIVTVKDLIDVLDTASTRWAAGKLFEGLNSGLGEIQQTVGTVTGFFDGLGRLWGNIPRDTKPAVSALDGLAGTLDQVSGAATRATRAQALLALQQSDTIDQARQFGISTRDLISASLGNEGAIKRVNSALESEGDLLKGLTAGSILGDIAKIGKEFEEGGDKIRQNARDLQTWGEALKPLENKKLRMDVKAIGMDMVTADLKTLNRQYDLTPKDIRTIVKATGMDLTKREIRDLIADLKNVDKTKVNPKVDADTKSAEAKLKNVAKQAGVFDKLSPRPDVDIDDRRAQAKFKDLFSMGQKYDNLKPEALARLADQASRPLQSIMDRLGGYGRTSKDARVGVNNQASGPLLTIFGQLNQIRDKTVTVTTRLVGGGGRGGPIPTATGAMVNSAQVRLIGEAGPEAVVPLQRPLSQVDPAVRELSAIAQGKIPAMARGGVVGGGRTVNVGGVTVISPSRDPKAVAQETVNRIVAVGY